MITKYRKWVARQQDLPLFAYDWWWDAVCGKDQWAVTSVTRGRAAWVMPYFKVRINRISRIVQPPWTQYTPIIDLETRKPLSGNDPEAWLVVEALLDSLPHVPIIELHLPPEVRLPGGTLQTDTEPGERKTVRIRAGDIPGGDPAGQYSTNLKRNLKSARETYVIETSKDPRDFFQMVQRALSDKHGGLHLDIDAGCRLAATLLKRNMGEITIARNGNGKVVGGILIAWDNHQAYYIIGGQHTGRGMPSAHSLLMHKAVSKAFHDGRSFDFCGSMFPGVMRFFQSFGGTTEPFYAVNRYRGIGRLKKLKKRLF